MELEGACSVCCAVCQSWQLPLYSRPFLQQQEGSHSESCPRYEIQLFTCDSQVGVCVGVCVKVCLCARACVQACVSQGCVGMGGMGCMGSGGVCVWAGPLTSVPTVAYLIYLTNLGKQTISSSNNEIALQHSTSVISKTKHSGQEYKCY